MKLFFIDLLISLSPYLQNIFSYLCQNVMGMGCFLFLLPQMPVINGRFFFSHLVGFRVQTRAVQKLL